MSTYHGKLNRRQAIGNAGTPTREAAHHGIAFGTAVTYVCDHYSLDAKKVHAWMNNNWNHPVAALLRELLKDNVPTATPKTDYSLRTGQQDDVILFLYVQEKLAAGVYKNISKALGAIKANPALSKELGIAHIGYDATRTSYYRGRELCKKS